MSDKMNMSLEDIINSSRSNRVGGNRTQQTNRRFNGTLNRGNFRSGTNRGQRSGIYGVQNGGIQKQQSFRGGMNNAWRHEASLLGPKRLFDMAVNTTTQSGGPTALLVSNLDFGVTDSDITELFSDFGPLIKAAVHYDRSGRSLGTADVVYERAADAIKAVKQYNGVPLDGRPMNIQYATSQLPPALPVSQSYFDGASSYRNFGNRQPTNRGGAGPRRNQPRFNAGRGGGNNRRPRNEPTAEELDAELDDYVNKMKL